MTKSVAVFVSKRASWASISATFVSKRTSGRSHKQRSKIGLTLEFDDPVLGIVRRKPLSKPFGIVRRKPLSVEPDTSLDAPALNGPNGPHLNFLTIDV